jgi:hypothetical protein
MAERVTQVDTVRGRGAGRVKALFARFGGGTLEARGVSRRDADALYATLRASKARLPVRRVTEHVCRHDEDVGTCTLDREA